MDNISPLAKTLAESNGIDWRAIQGTGAGGQIVEQDIINYLTRVMSGEEEPPPTPVDLPPPDWTGDELPTGVSAEMLSQAGVESDIAALITQVPVVEAPAGQGSQSQPAASIQEDEFELDLEDDAADDATVTEPTAAGAVVSEPVQPEPPRAEPLQSSQNLDSQTLEADEFDLPAAGTPAAAAPAPTPAAAAMAAPAAGGLGGLLSQLYQTPGSQPTAASSTPAPEPVREPEPVTEPSYTAPQTVVPVAAEPEVRGPEVTAPAVTESAVTESEPVAEPVTEPAYAQAEATQPTDTAAPSFTGERAAEPVAAASAPASAPAAAVVPAQSQGERPEKAVWLGVYLRRDVDLNNASDLRDQLNAALGQDVPLSLLVARAAQQHVSLLGLSSVAIHDAYAHRARPVGTNGTSLREALRALDGDYGDQPDVLVVNAGTFDLDEIHYPDTVSLSLGRVQDGRAALSLNGDLETVKAAEFLAAVAASLEAPVALII